MTASEPVLVTTGTLRDWPLPDPGSDKESRGRVLVLGGSLQTPGAVLLAGEAALRAGAGKLQMATARSAAAALAVAVPEGRVLPLPEREDGVVARTSADTVVAAASTATVTLVGPGLVDIDAVVELVAAVLPRLDGVLVLDALASAYLTEHPDGVRHLSGRCVLTLNPTELSRLLRQETESVTASREAQVSATVEAARRTGAVVHCGGPEKTVARPGGEAWLVTSGGAGLGVSGSGDTQAGIVAGLLARGADPAQAAVWGGWLHGTAGDRLAVATGPVGYLARELPAQLPGLLAELSARR